MTDDWEFIKKKYPIGVKLDAIVDIHAPFGVIVALDNVDFRGVIPITDFEKGTDPRNDTKLSVGSKVEAKVVGHKEAGEKQLWLSLHLSSSPVPSKNSADEE